MLCQCKQTSSLDNTETTINSLQQIINGLKPGLGEYMMQLEYHHDRLKTAAEINNIERVSYETEELAELPEKIKLFHNKHEKLQAKTFTEWTNAYIKPSLKSIKDAVLTTNQTNIMIATNKLLITAIIATRQIRRRL